MSRPSLNMKRTNFWYPPEMIERMKVLKERTGESMSDIIRKAIERALTEAGV